MKKKTLYIHFFGCVFTRFHGGVVVALPMTPVRLRKPKISPNRLPQQESASRRLLARMFMVNFWGDHLPKYYVYIIYVCCSWGYFITWLKHIWVNALLVSPCSASEMSAFFARPICSLIRCSMVFPDYFSVAMFFFTNFVRTSRWFWEWGPWKHFLFHQHHVWYWVNLRKWWCFAIAITVWSLDIITRHVPMHGTKW